MPARTRAASKRRQRTRLRPSFEKLRRSVYLPGTPTDDGEVRRRRGKNAVLNDKILEEWVVGKWWALMLKEIALIMIWVVVAFAAHQLSKLLWWILLHPEQLATSSEDRENKFLFEVEFQV